MRNIVAIFIVLLSVATAHAGASSKGLDWNDNSGIVKPNVATGGMRIDADRVSFFKNGDMAIMKEINGKEVWLAPWQAIPAGRTYVGFKIVSGSYGATYYEFYWR